MSKGSERTLSANTSPKGKPYEMGPPYFFDLENRDFSASNFVIACKLTVYQC